MRGFLPPLIGVGCRTAVYKTLARESFFIL
jgi:hypothetical protein